MNFKLSKEDLDKISTWNIEQDKKTIEKQKQSKDAFIRHLAKDNIPYYGATGGSLTYCFTPHGLGVTIIIKHSNGEELDITDYDNW